MTWKLKNGSKTTSCSEGKKDMEADISKFVWGSLLAGMKISYITYDSPSFKGKNFKATLRSLVVLVNAGQFPMDPIWY